MDPLNILIVEDETVTAANIQETLEKAGHRVTATTRTYHEALAAARYQPPDLALIDIQLESDLMDGIATARALLEQHWMPIVYLTANSELPTVERARATAPAAYLLKPFRPNELTIQVELAYHNFVGSGGLSTSPFLTDGVFLPFNKGYERIMKQDVLYMRAAGSYTQVMMTGEGKARLFTLNLGALAQYFPDAAFYRLSRSLVINLNHVSRLEQGQVFLNQVAVAIPDGSRAGLLKKLSVVRTR
ncbi:MAG: response regulator [Spirosoma sp.]|nr:response regulator [Spirosoma sp.]